VTPFVDVVLVLLIIFMVVTPLLQRGVDVLLPSTRHHADQKDTGEQIIVSVRKDGAVFLGQDRVDHARLEELLRRLLQRRPTPPVFVKGDRRLTFGRVRPVLEVCHRAGAAQISLATQSAREGGR
jgi:biopolymer transport protein TolR